MPTKNNPKSTCRECQEPLVGKSYIQLPRGSLGSFPGGTLTICIPCVTDSLNKLQFPDKLDLAKWVTRYIENHRPEKTTISILKARIAELEAIVRKQTAQDMKRGRGD